MAERDLRTVLRDLEEAQLIRLESDGEPTGVFRHGLIQDTAYDSLLRPERRRLHLAVGRTLESAYAGRLDDVGDMLAAHFDEAGESAQALRLYARAGDLAAKRFANPEAAALYGRALELAWPLEVDDDLLADLGFKKGRALELAGQYAAALASYDELIEAGRRSGSSRLELTGLMASALILAVPTEVYDLEAATQLSDRALHLARALKDSAAESRILWTQMRALSMSDPHKAVEAGEASLALARSLGLREQVAFTLNDLPYGYLGAGRLPDALRVLEEARQSWTESDNQPMLADNLASTAALLVLVGEFDQGFHLARESLEIAERIGNLWGQAYARMPMSQAYYLLGDLGTAIVCLRQCLKLAEPAGFLDPQVTMRSLHGVCLAMAGDAQAGLAEVKRAESLAKINYVRLIGTTIAARTLVLTLAGDLDGALREAEDLARVAGPGGLMLEETSFLAGFAAAEVDVLRRDPDHLLALIDRFDTFVERFHVGAFRFCLSMYRGVALTQKGQWEDAAKHLEAAVRAMGTVGADLAQWRPYAALAEVRERQGQAVEARRCHVEAASRLERIVSGLPEERLQRLFKARADVRRELQAAA